MSIFRAALNEVEWSESKRGLIHLSKHELIDVILRMADLEAEQLAIKRVKIVDDLKAGKIPMAYAEPLIRETF